MCVLYVGAGLNHFIHTGFYLKIMPWYLPFPLELVYISGVAEFILGILFAFQKTRPAAAWLIIAMLIVFLTVHVQMIIDNYATLGATFWISLLRLPLQFVLIRWAYKLRDTDFKTYKNRVAS